MWVKSSYSNPSGNCVELTARPAEVSVRDSKDPRINLVIPRRVLMAFLRDIKRQPLAAGSSTSTSHTKAPINDTTETINEATATSNNTYRNMTDQSTPHKEAPMWIKSSYSNNGGSCVELATRSNGIGIRDSKDPHGPTLTLPRRIFTVFLRNIKNGDVKS